MGMAQAADGTWYVVANYSPPGNISGQFPLNVLKPKSEGSAPQRMSSSPFPDSPL